MHSLLTFSVFALFASAVSGLSCRTGWHFDADTGSCYAIPTGAEGSWAEAMAYCGALGGELAIVESAGEHRFLVSLINTTKAAYPHDKDFWIGAVDILEEGVFIWAYRLSEVENFFWGRGEPNNQNGGQGCLRMESELAWAWGDGDCTSKEYFICEREAEG
ncbi:perlucin-like [Pomacea canaliculata]|uniref:perlucin-like n=1 Tax=Pomacea canaliculata TaxID=400727 RepID=UPI000D72D51C|nr:perlucin-like [Pomacea canaliculata]